MNTHRSIRRFPNVRAAVGLLMLAAGSAVAHGQQPATHTQGQNQGQNGGQPSDSWRAQETLLDSPIQLTSREKFVKAGEAYFNSDASWIIFQATPVPDAGQAPAPFYSMYVAKLARDQRGYISGIEEPRQISPPGSANTCGWFHPIEPARVIYGSTMTAPASDEKSGFQVGSRKYVWAFPSEMEVVTQTVLPMVQAMPEGSRAKCGNDYLPTPLFSRPGYDAECSYDASGRFVIYANVDPKKTSDAGRPDADIWVYDTKLKTQTVLVQAPGYDGGPFLSPDGKRLCYRSDRKGNDLLQLFVADLKFGRAADGAQAPVGIEREYAVTDNEHVNWAPFWHPSGMFLIYASSEVGHDNYEVFAVQAPPKGFDGGAASLRRQRVTWSPGADVLPVFSADGRWMMWTSQRGGKIASEERPSSQIWIARFTGSPFAGQPAPTAAPVPAPDKTQSQDSNH